MLIDFVLTACNNNPKYLNLYPYVYQVWKKKFNLDCYLILIDDKIPEVLNEYKDYIVLFKPIENINTAYIAQTIRILYPCLFEDKNILITDVDILPISKKYFIDSIIPYDNNNFICYTQREQKRKMIPICYNLANSRIWKEIFNINSINDVKQALINWYDGNYTGIKNSQGWFTDQKKLFEKVYNWGKSDTNLIILQDKNIGYKRLDKRKKSLVYVLNNKDLVLNDIKEEKYNDFHIFGFGKRDKYKKLVDEILKTILQ